MLRAETYAADLAVWAERCIKLSPHASKLDVVAKAVAKLSMGFTRQRGLIGTSYLDDDANLSAYLLFYFLTSYAQGREILGEMDRPLGDVLDVGAGPGPMAFAALDAGATSVEAVDQSER